MRKVNEKLNSKTRDELQCAKQENKDEGKIRELESQLTQCDADKAKIEQEIAELEAQRGRMNEGPKRFGTDVRHDSERIQHASVESPLGSQMQRKVPAAGVATSRWRSRKKKTRANLSSPGSARQTTPSSLARSSIACGRNTWAAALSIRPIICRRSILLRTRNCSTSWPGKFIENNYDLRWLHRTIATSRTYQLSASPPAVKQEQLTAARRNYASFQLRRLPAEVLVDAVNDATGSHEEFPKQLYLAEKSRAIEVAGVTSREDQEAALELRLQNLRPPAAQRRCAVRLRTRHQHDDRTNSVSRQSPARARENLQRSGQRRETAAKRGRRRPPHRHALPFDGKPAT